MCLRFPRISDSLLFCFPFRSIQSNELQFSQGYDLFGKAYLAFCTVLSCKEGCEDLVEILIESKW